MNAAAPVSPSLHVFVGPTLGSADVRSALPNAIVCPPASRGDVYRAVRAGATIVVLIDGYFRGVPSVWHKEILWALSRGVRVVGGASMGAIRASEMSAFGMEGVGSIYESFASTALCGSGDGIRDDEVMMIHASADDGYRPMSTPLADLRATLHAATAAGIIGVEARDAILAMANATPFPERDARLLVEAAAHERVDVGDLATWMSEHWVARKRLDALEVLDHVRLTSTLPLARPWPAFDVTGSFSLLVREEAVGSVQATSVPGDRSAAVLDELLLDPDETDRVRAHAARRESAARLADSLDVPFDRQAIDEASNAIRLRLALLEASDVFAWMERNDLDRDGYAALVRREAALRWSDHTAVSDLRSEALDQLRIEGHYERLAGESMRTKNILNNAAVAVSGRVAAGPSDAIISEWAETRNGRKHAPRQSEHDEGEGAWNSTSNVLRSQRRTYSAERITGGSLERRDIFRTPVWTIDGAVDELSLALADEALRLERETPSRLNSNLGGFQSERLDDRHPLIAQFFARIRRHVDTVMREASLPDAVIADCRLPGAWLNVNRWKDHNAPHHHAPSLIAGVMYLDSAPERGSLRFVDTSRRPGAGVEGWLDNQSIEVEPIPGRLVLFPGSLWHYVSPNQTHDARISLAFNVDVRSTDGR